MAGINASYACAKSHNGVHDPLDFKVMFHSGNLPFIGTGAADKDKILVCGWRHHGATWLKLQSKPGPLEIGTKKIMEFSTGSMPVQQLHPCFQIV